tara:strand:+ start:168 stop:344 length:177 start_codon:yes stop_codon:yes gene_type:complete
MSQKKIIRIPLRFRDFDEQKLYFQLRKISNIKNKSLNRIILDAIKSQYNDNTNRDKNA